MTKVKEIIKGDWLEEIESLIELGYSRKNAIKEVGRKNYFNSEENQKAFVNWANQKPLSTEDYINEILLKNISKAREERYVTKGNMRNRNSTDYLKIHLESDINQYAF